VVGERFMDRWVYPFAAIVGQDELKLALLVNVVDPGVGGVLVRGEKGTGKSTAVRAVAQLLPEQEVVAGCPYGCDPGDISSMCEQCRASVEAGEELEVAKRRVRVVELPVGASEDRLVGTIDMEAALTKGQVRFMPGILAAANRQILYVDEVNLLDDHLVDSLLDAAAMGVNTVERENVSVAHPARFTLVGTMNPEEGELRPQLLDRFGLCVQVKGLEDPDMRAEVVRRRLEFEKAPGRFIRRWAKATTQLKRQVARARRLLPRVSPSPRAVERAVEICLGLGVDGHRGDITTIKCARVLAALDGRKVAEVGDVERAAVLALPHRLRRRPMMEMDFDIAEKIARL